ncbi:hypothetical protein L0244_12085 [bacterium]|nr:hypothetical protein [bacterium]
MNVDRHLPICLAVILSSLLLCQTANACKPVSGYVSPSNYELVKIADAIVLGRAINFSENEEQHTDTVTLSIEKVLKGKYSERSITVEGYDNFRGRSVDSDFSEARPGAYLGSCIAFDYRKNHLYLLFLKFGSGGWRVPVIPFTRVNEEVDYDSPWIEVVEQYIAISKENDYETEKSLLRRLRQSASKKRDVSEKAIVRDIDDHFARPSKYKSVRDLVEMYSRAKSKEQREEVIYSLQEKVQNCQN